MKRTSVPNNPAFFPEPNETNTSVVFKSSQQGNFESFLKAHNKSCLLRESSQPGPYISLTYKEAENRYKNKRFVHTENGWINVVEYRNAQQCGLLKIDDKEPLTFDVIQQHLQDKKAYYPEEPGSQVVRGKEAKELSAVVVAWRGRLHYANLHTGEITPLNLQRDQLMVWQFNRDVQALPVSQQAHGMKTMQVVMATESQLNTIAFLADVKHHESLDRIIEPIVDNSSGYELFQALSQKFDMSDLLHPTQDQASNSKHYTGESWHSSDWERYSAESKKELPRPGSPVS